MSTEISTPPPEAAAKRAAARWRLAFWLAVTTVFATLAAGELGVIDVGFLLVTTILVMVLCGLGYDTAKSRVEEETRS